MDNEKKELPNEAPGKMALLKTQFPPIKVLECNPRYARILSESYAGATSELSAITMYLYQHHDSADLLPEFSSSLKEIAIGEMHHFDILAELIKLLGGDLRYHNSRGRQWTPRNIRYLTGAPYSQLLANIQAEKAAITQYRQQIAHICDPHVQRILECIIQDEEEHIKIFEQILDKFCQCPR